MKKLLFLIVVLSVMFTLAYVGVFNVAADDAHWGITQRVIEFTRERSIGARALDIGIPKLGQPAQLAVGAEHYREMCEGCHLGPGVEQSELRSGLNPMPPNLAEGARQRKPAEMFWIIKHGIKMTGMPAWGVTHDDDSIWALVAFVTELPSLSAERYAALSGPGEEGLAPKGRSAEPTAEPHPDSHSHAHSHSHEVTK